MAIQLLIVDDEIPLLRNLSSYLGSFDGEFEIRTAAAPELALQELADNPQIDVLLTDVRMPGIDGIELVQRALAMNRNLRVVVMTAFSSSDLRTRARAAGALRFLEKPLDVKHLHRVLREVAEAGAGWSGSLAGFDLFDFIQLFVLSGRSTLVEVSDGEDGGVLVFKDGRLIHASAAELEGDEAFYRMAGWGGGEFRELPVDRAAPYTQNVTSSTNHLMMEAARRRDEARRAVDGDQEEKPGVGNDRVEDLVVEEPEAGHPPSPTETEVLIMAIREHLGELEEIEGFGGAAVFTPQGEMLEGLAPGQVDIRTIGMYANNALLNAQKATDHMGVGRGNLVQIRSPQAVVLMRCMNEATDFSATREGKAHFHTVVVMDPEGNIGMASMVLDRIQALIVEEMR